jgi:hypothetical protein
MATVRISQSATHYTIEDGLSWSKHIVGGNFPVGPAVLSGSSTSGAATLLIYKGTPETFPSFTDRATRASDVLITFTLGANTASFTQLGTVGQFSRWIIGKQLTQTSAAASGLASWFLLCRSGTTSLTDKGALLGTVGLVGSGADLEVASTNIVSGQYYTSAGLYINMPYDWTV